MKRITTGRLDWSGGWSDTPPLSYDMGGKVVNFALQFSEKVLLHVWGINTIQIFTKINL